MINTVFATEHQSIQWVDLLPEDDLRALLEAPIPEGISEGSAVDQINSPISMTIKDPIGEYEKALMSVRIRAEFDDRDVRLPGFVVPIETNDAGLVTSFFLVPFFGACIHLPPPPPNQIIYISYPQGLSVDDLEVPYWLEMKLFTQQVANQMATAAYSAVVSTLYPFKEGDEY